MADPRSARSQRLEDATPRKLFFGLFTFSSGVCCLPTVRKEGIWQRKVWSILSKESWSGALSLCVSLSLSIFCTARCSDLVSATAFEESLLYTLTKADSSLPFLDFFGGVLGDRYSGFGFLFCFVIFVFVAREKGDKQWNRGNCGSRGKSQRLVFWLSFSFSLQNFSVFPAFDH